MIGSEPLTARTAYTQELVETLTVAERLATLPQFPTRLLALNATFYLADDLPQPLYRVALDRALAAAANERDEWLPLPSGIVAAGSELEQLVHADASRPVLYRWLFQQAVATGQPERLVLAQHAVEMAGVLADADLPRALRFGLLTLPESSVAAEPLLVLPSTALLIESVSRALLCRQISATQFVVHLLALHAAHRAYAVTEPSFDAPLRLAAAAIQPLLRESAMQYVPKRLRIAQRCELAQRAVHHRSQPDYDLAVLAVEAGLMEAETLSSGQQLLLFSALDRLLSS